MHSDAQIAHIVFPLPLNHGFDYNVPTSMTLKRGDFVHAPLGLAKTRLGIVWEVRNASTASPLKNQAGAPLTPRETSALKFVESLHAPLSLTPAFLDFLTRMATYNCMPLGLITRLALPATSKALYPPKPILLYKRREDISSLGSPRRLTLAQKRVFDLPYWNEKTTGLRASVLGKMSNVSPATITTMAKTGLLECVPTPPALPEFAPAISSASLLLNADQKKAANACKTALASKMFNVILLDGITGSGKTEVYLQAIKAALQANKQVLVMVPEIALTQAVLARFASYFADDIASWQPKCWHSGLSPSARQHIWHGIAAKEVRLIVGARSALFLPFQSLALLIIDEEHDSSYKQEEGLIYNARDMAVLRGYLSEFTVILASATPSLESLKNARQGRYQHIRLTSRIGTAVLPTIELIDMKEHNLPADTYLSPPLLVGVKKAIATQQQALLYLNRRGFAPLILCQKCGTRLKSPDTDKWLSLHQASRRAVCHLTGFSMPMPTACPECKSEGSLKPIGPGVERIAQEVRRHFSDACIEILSSDTAQSPDHIQNTITRMAKGEIDILIGTQMVSKGHNFPKLSFVGVVDGDLTLMNADFRAGERTYQALVQIAGRAGRSTHAGHAMIQTHMPEHEAMQALKANERDMFIDAELSMRETLNLPPYGRLAALILSAPTAPIADAQAQYCLSCAPPINAQTRNVEILGPSLAPIAILRGRHRRRFLIQADKHVNLSQYMQQWRKTMKLLPSVRLHIDIDPYSFM